MQKPFEVRTLSLILFRREALEISRYDTYKAVIGSAVTGSILERSLVLLHVALNSCGEPC